ncbi:hypothetical protein O181_042123 [Austropuccinia psidii MF-1]|uniref:Helicase SKI2W n=1 Tax=Austropuccinia psidii MF-1 TaxID=1389203 RepID=A0A9Q3DKJ1_9BASI|nr:hypothetical protein [Austropuccinia psidii MF-1]
MPFRVFYQFHEKISRLSLPESVCSSHPYQRRKSSGSIYHGTGRRINSWQTTPQAMALLEPVKRSQITHWDDDPLMGLVGNDSIRDLFYTRFSHLNANIEFIIGGLEGNIVGWRELLQGSGPQETAKTSLSINRQPAHYSSGIERGRSGFVPFAPGGLELPNLRQHRLNHDHVGITDEIEKGLQFNRGGIRTIPPGFTRGLDFDTSSDGVDAEEVGLQAVSCGSILVDPKSIPSFLSNEQGKDIKSRKENAIPSGTGQIDVDLDALLPDLSQSLTVSVSATAERHRPGIAKRDWAHIVDVHKDFPNFKDVVPVMAREYPFELDTFQKEAIYHLEMGDSIFVAAHTSAGKTVVAEYAIALASRHMTKCIYTSPIKALSNQKFRDFKQTFDPDTVGILTGDVQVNSEGSCLIMTTEILRSMLYKGADLIRDVEFVVFDEVHYINDLERGVVWEEVIIMLPSHVVIILLSATVPNTKEFADWVGRTKKKDIYVISTPKRPVPLEHFLYANKELYKIVDARSQFLGQGLKDAGEALKRLQVKERESSGRAPLVRMGAAARGQEKRNVAHRGGSSSKTVNQTKFWASAWGGGGGSNSGKSHEDQNLWVHLVGVLRKKQLLPVVAFTFSKIRCEANAASMPNTDLCSAKEKSEIHIVVERSLNRLQASEKKLPQILRVRDLLSRGIGIHHGGLLPIIKELVEILFSRGLVKVLFATETFAMGVNMPARCVVFSSIQKHDGQSFRDLLPSEYTQMSGRAGRRGLDSTGVVIIICNEQPPDSATLHQMILGQPTKLKSQFRLTYNMILNLLRVEALRVEEMIKRSFSENAQQRLLPDQQKKIVESERELQEIKKQSHSEHPQDLREYYAISSRLVDLTSQIIDIILSHPSGSRALCCGRIVILKDGHFQDNLAVILKPAQSLQRAVDGRLDQTRSYFVLAFVPPHIRAGSHDVPPDAVPPRWPPIVEASVQDLTYELAVVPSTSIAMLTKHTLSVDGVAIAERHLKSHMTGALEKFISMNLMFDLAQTRGSRLLATFELEHPKLRAFEFKELLHCRASELNKLESLTHVEEYERFEEQYTILHQEELIMQRISLLKASLSDQNLELLPGYESRLEVLKELKFIDDRATVLLKGRVACEINTSHELVLTEVILENTLADYDPAETVALLSSLVFQDKTETEPMLTPNLEKGCAVFKKIANRVEAVSLKHKVENQSANRGKSLLNFGMVEIVWQWAQGMPFAEVTTLSDIQEGTIVRTMTRLDDSCREIRDAARIIGDITLGKKMEDCQALIRRDVIFVTSLYL